MTGMESDMKQCSKCGETKPLSEYYKRTDTKSGYHAQCKECVKGKVSEAYFANPEPAKQRSKVWRKDNPERVKENNKNWLCNNHEYAKQKNAEWRSKNIDRHRSNSIDWAKKNRNKKKASEQQRRINKSQNSFYKIKPKEIKKLYNSPCIYCGSKDNITVDHVIPIKLNGTHGIGNLVSACRSCNCSKGAKTITEWKMAKRKAAK